MKKMIALAMLFMPATALAEDAVYKGTWRTTNRKLDGRLACVVTDLGNHRWRGHFRGEWNGTPFSYTVTFTGPADKLHGTAVIDGADYEWNGWIHNGRFRANFGGNRYVGGFDLSRSK